MAFHLAIFRVPSARQVVTTGGDRRPAIPVAAMAVAMAITWLDVELLLRGHLVVVRPCSRRRSSRSVFTPVPITTARARPTVTTVPLYTTHVLSCTTARRRGVSSFSTLPLCPSGWTGPLGGRAAAEVDEAASRAPCSRPRSR